MDPARFRGGRVGADMVVTSSREVFDRVYSCHGIRPVPVIAGVFEHGHKYTYCIRCSLCWASFRTYNALSEIVVLGQRVSFHTDQTCCLLRNQASRSLNQMRQARRRLVHPPAERPRYLPNVPRPSRNVGRRRVKIAQSAPSLRGSC
jgi:hypothetical protein